MSRAPLYHAIAARPLALFIGAVAFSGALATSDATASTPPAFLPAVSYATGGLDTIFPNSGGPIWVLAADVNGDSQLDLVVANWCVSVSACASSNVGVLLNTGHGTFQPVVTYDTGGYHAFAVSINDMNGDDIPDLIVANGCGDSFNQPGGCPDGSASVLLGNGDGTFQASHSFPSGGSLSALVVADVNRDGHPDVVVSNCAPSAQLCPAGNGNVGVLLGNADGSLQPVTLYDSGGLAASFVAVADVNGDHEPDVLVSNQRICDNCRGTLGVLLGRGDGTFHSVQTYDTGLFAPAFIAIADFNGDHSPDMVLTQNIGGGGELAVLLNRGDGTFETAAVYETGGLYATPLVIADANGDGKPDLMVSHAQFCTGSSPSVSCIGVLLGNGDGSFQPAVTYESGGIGAWSLTAADFNGDGNVDVAVAHQCRPPSCTGPAAVVGVLAGNGDGSFQPAVTYDTHSPSVLALAADVNGDGKPDLVIGNAPPVPEGTIDVLLNNSTPDDTLPPIVTLLSSRKRLWPPNGALLPVKIAGTIVDTGSGVDARSAVFAVTDEYGQIQPAGAITLGSSGTYSFTVALPASRRDSDRDGRHYTVTVRAKDNAGNTGSMSIVVIVPHDQRD
jgi:VCBS repeat protein/FG-GAP repeat protein